MSRYLLDTNVVSQPGKTKPSRAVLAWLDAVDDGDLMISATTVHELWYGVAQARAAKHPRAEDLARGVDAIIDAYAGRVVPLETRAAKIWAELLAARNSHVNDRCLVAIASANRLILVTRNVRHTAGLGVPVLDPFVAPARRY